METASLVRQKDAAYRARDNAIEKFTIERRGYQDEANGLRANLRLAEAQRDAWQENVHVQTLYPKTCASLKCKPQEIRILK